MRLALSVFALTLLVVPAFAFAQNQNPSSVTSSGKDTSDSGDQLQKEIDMMKSIFETMFNQVEMSEEQKKDIFATLDENIPAVTKAKRDLKAALTKEEAKLFKGHFRFGRVAGFTVLRAQGYALNQLKLSPERQKMYLECKEKADYQDLKLKNEIVSLLSKEQREKIPMFSTNKTKEYAVGIIAPNMKTKADAEKADELLSAIDGVKVKNINLEKQLIKVHMSSNEKTQSEVHNLFDEKTADEIFKDYEFSYDNRDGLKELLFPENQKNKSAPNSKSESEKPAAKETESSSTSSGN